MKFNDNAFRFSFAEAVVLKEDINAEVGQVVTGAPGSLADVTVTQDGSRVIFDFVIPQGESGAGAVIDSGLSDNSENPVENRAIKEYVDSAVSELSGMISSVGEMAEMLGTVPEYTMTAEAVSPLLAPGYYYVFPKMAALEIRLIGGESGKVSEYRFRFTSGSTPTVLTLPAGTVGSIDIQADTVYEVTLHDGYLKYHSWAVSGT